jgi:dihydrofolate reductase
MTFHASVFIAVSLDGFIARPDGDLGWLTGPAEGAGDTGYDDFVADVDTVVLGRGTYETVLTFGEWPYGDRHVAVLSTRLAPDTDPRVTVHRDLDALVHDLTARGAKHVYVDGGQVVQAFLRAGLVRDLTITTAPVLLGAGIPLFGPLDRDVALTHRATRVLGAGFVQSSYAIAA